MRDVQAFQEALAEGAQAVEAHLDLLLPAADAYPAVIHEAMRYGALGGGKRLRGILVREAARLGGAPTPPPKATAPARPLVLTPEAMRAAGPVGAVSAAVEMIHAYSLIHDDLPSMDDDDLRRGKPTTHIVFGEGMAVLAGDALLTRAFEVLARLEWAGATQEAALAVMGELAVAAGTAGLIGGQVVDLEAEGSLTNREAAQADPRETLAYIHTHKTGALFRASLRAGALLAGVDDEALESVTRYAHAFGVAFQIVDDLLDVEGDESKLGKKTGSDQRKGKLTYPALYGVETSRRLAREYVEQAKEALRSFGRDAWFLTELAEYVYSRQR